MAGENNNQAVRTYQKQFKELLQAVFKKESVFAPFFGGGLQVLDGVAEKDTAFSVKTSDIPTVIRIGDVIDATKSAYSQDENVAFGTGTGKSSRFGDRTEIIYDSADVKYAWDWVIHEGIDRHTVNLGLADAVADRSELQALEKTEMFDNQGGKFISNIATAQKLAAIDNDTILAFFNTLSAYYINKRAVGTKLAWVRPELYNAIVDHPLTTTAKSSAANIDSNGILNFKGFRILETPDDKFQAGEYGYASIAGVGRQFTGINTMRTIESEDFDGVAFQGAGKAGEYILPANEAAVIKFTDKDPVVEAGASK